MARKTIVRYKVLCTNLEVYEAWEPTDGLMSNRHSTLRSTGDGGWLGKVATRSPSEAILAMPPGKARIAAVLAHYDAAKAEALAAIYSEYPELREAGEARDGDVEVWH